MNRENARTLIETTYPNMTILRSFEYDDCYVFVMIPQNGSKDKQYLDSTFAVDKETGDIFVFQPWRLTPSEYKRGVEF